MAGQLEKGQRIGQYEILGRLGKGGMASVYRAYEPSLDRQVAIKLIADQYANDPAFVERFRREARSIARLRHPNILTIYTIGENEGALYIVMELIEGQTLKEELEGKPLSLERVDEIIKQVASALDYANKNGIIHRDVKPSNILIDNSSGRAVLGDFGIAKMAEADSKLTGTGTGVGTPDYMSPEQAMGDSLDARSDQYSLAIVAYEMLTGRAPFTGDTPIAVAMGHVSKPVPRPTQFNPTIPPALEQVLMKALSKKPTDRYESCGAFERAFANAMLIEDAGTTQAINRSTTPAPNIAQQGAEAEKMYQEARHNEQTNNFVVAFNIFNQLNSRYPNYRDVPTLLERYRAMGYTTQATTGTGWQDASYGNPTLHPTGTQSGITNTNSFYPPTPTVAPIAIPAKKSPLPLVIGGGALLVVVLVVVLIIVLAGGNNNNRTTISNAVTATTVATTAPVVTTAPPVTTAGGLFTATTLPVAPTTPAVAATPTTAPTVTPTLAPATTPVGQVSYKPLTSSDGSYSVQVVNDWQYSNLESGPNALQEKFNPPEGDFYVTIFLVRVNLAGQTNLDQFVQIWLDSLNNAAKITKQTKGTYQGVPSIQAEGTLTEGAVTFNMKFVAFIKNNQFWVILYGVSPQKADVYEPIYQKFISTFAVK